MIISDLNYEEISELESLNIIGGVRAPGCVDINTNTSTFRTNATITNNCGYTLNARAIWNFAIDDSCNTLDNGEAYKSSRGRQATVERVDLC
ncbi:hypothetical protein SAMD00079811_66460 [Scytonema sp. HK-05]|uniref:hypothetical protein n=1 Tax=Scytonema sp. HK-05 TaxID=1137095 RepID=UPI000937B6FF|nr:hypothetical protein [Scytonema sp. HK-05]OKH57808.1 hypothetical protein NIES2130_17465 [Scytonema sp. HK-05]BAY49017.1 hypothetical protein SAMD00079811_66460 [Scytonema sp. HK-05]